MKFLTTLVLTYFSSLLPLSSGQKDSFTPNFNENLTISTLNLPISDEVRAFLCVLENARKSSEFLADSVENFMQDDRIIQPYRLKKIVIDAGHGGKDPGCQSRGMNEKDNTLAMSLKLGRRIKAEFPDMEVVYTRTTDVFIELDERAQIANRAKADLFLSIHCNSTDENSGAHGTETYVLGKHKEASNFEVSRRENASILLEKNYEENYEGFDPNSIEAYIIFSYNQKKHLQKSRLFAQMVEKEMVSTSKRKSLGVKEAGFWVLHRTAMPSVLFEAGFLNHPTEGRFLSSDEGQDRIVDGLFEAFVHYKNNVENGENAPPPVSEPKTTAKQSVPKATPQSPTFSDRRTYEVAPDNAETVFKVQVAASELPISDTKTGKWKGLDLEIRQENGMFKYLVGPTSSKSIADATRDRMRVRGFADAVVVTYKNGKRVR